MKRKLSLLLLMSVGAAILALSQPGKGVDESGARIDAAWLARNETQLRRIFNMPPRLGLAFKQQEKSPSADYVVVVLEIVREGQGRQPFQIFVSADGRRVVYDRLYDLADPFGPIAQQIDLTQAPALGPENAPVTVVEYSDYTCGYCRRFFETLEPELLRRYADQVRFVYKHFPAIGARAHAAETAVAAACAFRQSNQAFWAVHRELFANLSEYVRKEKEDGGYLKLARKARLNGGEFRRCFENRDSLPDVVRDQQEGYELQLEGTPSFFINGRPVPGLPSADYFFQIIEQELALAGKSGN